MIELLRTFTPRAEIILEEVPAPQKLAAYSFAFTADISNGLSGDAEEEVASGRFVILHEPGGQDTWEGEFRCVTFMRADVDSEMQEDPLLPEVGWNWLLDSLQNTGAEFSAPSGTVTRVSSASFGKLSPRSDDSEIEIRASWSPQIESAEDIFSHVQAWCNLMTEYSARAYLIQIKRTNGGLHLIDPIPFGPHHPCFIQLNSLISNEEVILHASTQDLPCLRELGIEPQILFDTELGGRIAGLPRVGLGPLLETLMGVSLAKEHSAADWSKRPLPSEWLNYAALDVELLVELRDKVYQLLVDAGKWEWAQEDFASIISAPPPPARIDPWRRTSGMHKIKKRLHMAVVRELWQTRNTLAQELDISPGRLLTDAAISEIALASENTPLLNRKHLEKVLRPIGLRARWFENSELWITSIASALALTEDQCTEHGVRVIELIELRNSGVA